MLEAVDARGFADARVGNLSGGEQQRVLIAHALDRPAAAAAAGRAAGQPRHPQRPGGRRPARPDRPEQRHRGADLRPRHEPAAAGDGPGRLPRRRAGRQRHDRGGRPHRGAHRALRPPRSTCCASTGGSLVVGRRPRPRERPSRRPPRPSRSTRDRSGTALFEPGFFSSAPVHAALDGRRRSSPSSRRSVGVFTVMRGQSFAGHALGRHRHRRRIRRVPGRRQPAARVRRRRRWSAAAAMELSASGGRGAATWRPASSSAPRSASPRCSSTRTPPRTARPARRSPSCSARSSRSTRRSSRSLAVLGALALVGIVACSTARCC